MWAEVSTGIVKSAGAGRFLSVMAGKRRRRRGPTVALRVYASSVKDRKKSEARDSRSQISCRAVTE
jgi:hypothetical protein